MAAMDLHTYDNTLYEKVYQTAYQAAAELIETAGMKAGQILVVGCSTSEVGGEKIGTYSSPELAQRSLAEFMRLCRKKAFIWRPSAASI